MICSLQVFLFDIKPRYFGFTKLREHNCWLISYFELSKGLESDFIAIRLQQVAFSLEIFESGERRKIDVFHQDFVKSANPPLSIQLQNVYNRT